MLRFFFGLVYNQDGPIGDSFYLKYFSMHFSATNNSSEHSGSVV